VTAPLVLGTPPRIDFFDPGNGLPIIDRDGTLVDNQPDLDDVLAAAQAEGIVLRVVDGSGLPVSTGDVPLNLGSPESYTTTQQQNGRDNLDVYSTEEVDVIAANRVRVDTNSQGLSGTQQTNARANIKAAVIPTGTPDGTKFYRDDGTWAVPPGTGGGGGSTTLHYLETTASVTLSPTAHDIVVVTDPSHIITLPALASTASHPYKIINQCGSDATLNAQSGEHVGLRSTAGASFAIPDGWAVDVTPESSFWRLT